MNQQAAPSPLILVVDDDLDIRNTVAGILEEEGYRVAKAGNGHEALTYLTTAGAPRPNLILLDMMMPIMDGAAFHDQHQKQPVEIASIPVITFTAFGAAPEVGWATARVPKPLRLETLLSLIAKHVS